MSESKSQRSRRNAFDRALARQEAKPLNGKATPQQVGYFEAGFNAGDKWRASRKPEAAPSNTERPTEEGGAWGSYVEYLHRLEKAVLTASEPVRVGQLDRATIMRLREADGEEFARLLWDDAALSQPVQVEVTDFPCAFQLEQCRCDLPRGHGGLHECRDHRFSDRPLAALGGGE